MVILASGSPRRKELLALTGVSYEIVTSDCDETPTKVNPEDIVMELSLRKGEDVYEKVVKDGRLDPKEENLLVAADTLVFLNDKRLGKPGTEENAIKMLKELSGKVHSVLTGVCLIYTNKGEKKTVSFFEKTDVSVYELTEKEIEEYAASGEPLDKAGAYAIQGLFAKYIKEIKGEYSNVVGLPIGRLYHEMVKICFLKEEN